MKQIIGFASEGDARRAGDAVRRTEGRLGPLHPSQDRPTTESPVLEVDVMVTGPARGDVLPKGQGGVDSPAYPAVVVYRNLTKQSQGAPDWLEAEDVFCFDINDVELVSGRRYRGWVYDSTAIDVSGKAAVIVKVNAYDQENGGLGSGGGSGTGSGAGSGGTPTPGRCSGNILSYPVERTENVGGYLFKYVQLLTLKYDAAGCVVPYFGPVTQEFLGCVDCGGCEDLPGYGSGSGSGRPAGPCLPGACVTLTLTDLVTKMPTGGNYLQLSVAVQLTRPDPAVPSWEGDYVNVDGQTVSFVLFYSGADRKWHLRTTYFPYGACEVEIPMAANSLKCSPFEVSFPGTNTCTGSDTNSFVTAKVTDGCADPPDGSSTKVPCCDFAVPNVLYLTISEGTGSLAALNGTYAVHNVASYDPANAVYYYVWDWPEGAATRPGHSGYGTRPDGHQGAFYVECTPGLDSWSIRVINVSLGNTEQPEVAQTFDPADVCEGGPFFVTFVATWAGAYHAGQTARITVTE